MKKTKIFFVIIVGLLLINSCKKDYLDTKPTSDMSPSTIFSTTKGGAMAINGICKLMTRQYLGTQGFNGEGTMKMYYGNYPGNHFTVNLPGWSSVINMNNLENTTSPYNYYPWYYYYTLIGNANLVIANIDNASGLSTEKQFIKAQALTFRAYSYFMLSQIYCKRWMDSNNGSSDGLVLRTDMSSGAMPLSTLGDVYQQIYDDLTDAITLYTASGLTRKKNYEPDINVAYAVYARASLTRQDYTTAATMAVNARNGYPLMSNTDYKAGFCNPTNEWIWSSWGSSDETLYFYSYHAYIAYNATSSAVKTYPKCISKELLYQIPATDIRRSVFLDTLTYTYNRTTGEASTALRNYARTLYPDMSKDGTGAYNGKVYAFMQFKIKANDFPGVGHLNHFRSSEMYLIEAEAKYSLPVPDEDGARAALLALNFTSGRDLNYTLSTNTGIALLNEIKMYRAIELWGEGFDWFDLKRWGDNINRKTFTAGGSFVTGLDVIINPSEKNGWVWRIPNKETDYNFDL